MLNYTLKQLRYFDGVAACGGVAQAARQLNISQPAIAQAIDKLEQGCGFALFVRHHARGLELTAQGRSFHREARKMLLQADRFSRAIESIGSGDSGMIRLGCFQSIAPFYLAYMIDEYRRQSPGIQLWVEELLHQQLLDKLSVGEMDLAIIYDMELDQELFKWHTITRAQPYIVLSTNHRLAKRKRLRLTELAREPYILFDAPGSRDYFYQLFRNAGINPPVAFRSTSLESVRSAVANGLGFSILSMRPRSNLSYDGRELRCLNIADNIEPMSVVIAHRADQPPDNAQSAFINYCKNQLSAGG